MTRTRDYHRLGLRRFRALIIGGDDTEPWLHTLRAREWRTRGQAEQWMRERLPRQARATSLHVVGQIREGVYVDASFDDPDYGPIHDVEFDDDDTARAYCYLGPSGAVCIDWEAP